MWDGERRPRKSSGNIIEKRERCTKKGNWHIYRDRCNKKDTDNIIEREAVAAISTV